MTRASPSQSLIYRGCSCFHNATSMHHCAYWQLYVGWKTFTLLPNVCIVRKKNSASKIGQLVYFKVDFMKTWSVTGSWKNVYGVQIRILTLQNIRTIHHYIFLAFRHSDLSVILDVGWKGGSGICCIIINTKKVWLVNKIISKKFFDTYL